MEKLPKLREKVVKLWKPFSTEHPAPVEVEFVLRPLFTSTPTESHCIIGKILGVSTRRTHRIQTQIDLVGRLGKHYSRNAGAGTVVSRIA